MLSEKIKQLKVELQESTSEQYKELLRHRIAKLEKYILTGSW